MNLEDVTTVGQFYDFMDSIVLPYAYGEPLFSYGTGKEFPEGMMQQSGAHMYLLGGIRMRQQRVVEIECEADYNFTAAMKCIDRKTEDTSDREEWLQIPPVNTIIRWKSYIDIDEEKHYQGYSKVFSGSGTVYDLPANNGTVGSAAEAHNKLAALRDNYFVDHQTRALFVDFNLFNTATDYHTLCRIVLE
eukprot:UN33221